MRMGGGRDSLRQAEAGWGRLQAEKNELSSNAEVM